MKSRVVRGGVWTVLAYGGGQTLRFGANILMAQILAPESFGLMGLITIVLVGLQMFSDIGIGPAIIQNKREDPAFLNTAWTMQSCRGVFLWLTACLLAYPLSLFFDEPRLLWLLPVASFSAVLQGLQSSNWFTANRHMAIKWMMLIEFVCLALNSIVMVALVYTILPNVWALVVGTLAASALHSLLSHFLPGIRNRFTWDRTAASELFHFGKWLFFSTVITFFAFQIDNILLQTFLGTATFGIWYIGRQLADLAKELFVKLGQGLGFPALSEVYRESPDAFYAVLLKVRMLLVIPINVILLGLVVLAPSLFYIAYPIHYWPIGWIVQALAINSLTGMLNTSYGHAYMATGRTFFNMTTVTGQLFAVVIPSCLGYALAGEFGFVCGVAISQLVKYPVDMMLTKRIGVWQWRFDFSVLIGSTLLAIGALYVATLLHEPSIAFGEEFRPAVGELKEWAKAWFFTAPAPLPGGGA